MDGATERQGRGLAYTAREMKGGKREGGRSKSMREDKASRGGGGGGGRQKGRRNGGGGGGEGQEQRERELTGVGERKGGF